MSVPSNADVEGVAAKVSRYFASTDLTSPQQRLLEQPIMIKIPETVKTVGGALRFVLENTGYALAPEINQSPECKYLYGLSVPRPHRSFDGVPLIEVIKAFGGSAYKPVIDDTHRLVAHVALSSIVVGQDGISE